jgi:hypothetical protein
VVGVNIKEQVLVMVLLGVQVVALVMGLTVMPTRVVLVQRVKVIKAEIKPVQVLPKVVVEVERGPPPQIILAVVIPLLLVVLVFLLQ